ncbi:MAG: hypothetical protein KHZ15_08450 [Coprobacillus cateniformis]|uniref:hypothetical protein n=1 Tax=Longibaculum muris TaxID=1796628 RepID=UPI003AB407D1|nr:hypothetical protein [Coprobacillus cateniformis]
MKNKLLSLIVFVLIVFLANYIHINQQDMNERCRCQYQSYLTTTIEPRISRGGGC